MMKTPIAANSRMWLAISTRRRGTRLMFGCRLSADRPEEFGRKNASPLADGHDGNGVSRELPAGFFNWEDVESATQYLSKANLRGKSNFCAVYRGILKDGSVVAVKSIKVGCCKSEEAGFMKGLSLLTSLRHKNLVAERFFAVRRAGANVFSCMILF
ncbi:hypothetical protein U1Q18_023456 [Sarracenia purpurea var. burkii]